MMGVVVLVFWAGAITAIVLAIRYLISSGSAGGGPPRYEPLRPEGVLAERFACGEIDEDECRRRITLLQEHR